MPAYILLMKLTDQGAKDIKGAPARIEAGIKAFEAMGGKVQSFHIVTGDYDYVTVGEAPDDEVALAFAMALGAGGNVHTTTLKGFTTDEMRSMIGKMP